MGIRWHGEPLRSNRAQRELAWILGICCEAEKIYPTPHIFY
jgi:hypothetical protein